MILKKSPYWQLHSGPLLREAKISILIKSVDRRTALERFVHLAGLILISAALPARAFRARADEPTAATQPEFEKAGLRRLAVVGGGMGGLATAWLCDPSWSVDLFEALPKLGGHCDSVVVEDGAGRPIHADIGAQFFHPDTHPLYVCLLEELGLFRDGDHAHDVSLEAQASLSFFSVPNGRVDFVSTQPLKHLIRAIDFAIYTRVARKAVLKHVSFETTVDDWAHGIAVTRDFREHILVPMISAMIGTTIENTRRCSARAILETFALSFPRNLLQGATTWNSRIGLQGNLMAMVDRCRNLSAYVSAPASRIDKTAEGWFVESPVGRLGPYDAIVLNTPPAASVPLVETLPWAAELASLLKRFEFFDSRLVIHRDPVYMPRNRRDWSVYNAGTANGSCEGSVWLGAIYGKSNGRREPPGLFKSWATHRDRQPKELVCERHFCHPLITPDAVRAARALQAWQGYEGLWFSGQFTTGVDLQETALYSATKAASTLAPDSANLAALRRRLAEKGLAGLSYDL